MTNSRQPQGQDPALSARNAIGEPEGLQARNSSTLPQWLSREVLCPEPAPLYKYRDWKDQKHQLLLRERVLHFSLFPELNDPSEYSYDLVFSDEDLCILKKEFDPSLLSTLGCANPPGTADEFIEALRAMRDDATTRRTANALSRPRATVYSMTLNPLSRPMWMHYARGHAGFCVEFNSRLILFLAARQAKDFSLFLPYKVLYSADPPVVGLQDIFRAFLTKHTELAYEEEVRFLSFEELGDVSVPDVFIRSVIFGERIADSDAAEIIGVLSGYTPRPAICQIRRDHGDYVSRIVDVSFVYETGWNSLAAYLPEFQNEGDG